MQLEGESSEETRERTMRIKRMGALETRRTESLPRSLPPRRKKEREEKEECIAVTDNARHGRRLAINKK